MKRTGLIAAGVGGLALLLVATGAKAQEPEEELPPPPGPEPSPLPDLPSLPKTPPSGVNPPNLSNDPAGYNTVLFPGPMAVRQWFINLGYSVLLKDTPLKRNRSVKKFQKDYNKVSKRPGNGSMGTLVVDGTAGRNTLNAVEIASMQVKTKQMSWNNIVKGG